ncbi:unnamed protein product [Cylicocyclus nassatus]|uniref:Uncharacterized protein n=1 Tax=Cylicocyclus nassatus TaxID=53992 RepID=A0AA36DRE9_CYLNA|nr:unnamed protein product [Cylicocyclus nassatus]
MEEEGHRRDNENETSGEEDISQYVAMEVELTGEEDNQHQVKGEPPVHICTPKCQAMESLHESIMVLHEDEMDSLATHLQVCAVEDRKPDMLHEAVQTATLYQEDHEMPRGGRGLLRDRERSLSRQQAGRRGTEQQSVMAGDPPSGCLFCDGSHWASNCNYANTLSSRRQMLARLLELPHCNEELVHFDEMKRRELVAGVETAVPFISPSYRCEWQKLAYLYLASNGGQTYKRLASALTPANLVE